MSSSANSSATAIRARLIKRYPAAQGEEGSQPFTLDIQLESAAGVTVLLGPSGAGKSLTLNCIAGFIHPDEGRILIDNELFFDAAAGISLPPERRRCGYVFQDHALFPHMSVRDNLRFAGSVAPTVANRGLHLRRRINELLEVFELTELAARKPGQLSGGQKQRAALARILVSEPRLLLLDEPTRGLDARLRSAFYELLQRTRERLQVPVILVTHDLDECFELADFVCLMDGGRFLQTGSRDDIFSRPATCEIARRLGLHNILPAVLAALDPARNTSQIRVLDGEIEGPYLPGHLIGDRGFLCVPASEIKAVPHTGRASAREIVLNILSSAPSSRGIRINLEHDIFITVSQAEFLSLRASSRVRLEIPRSAVYFLEK
jgi:molybdate transport system ATP-binding protein